MKVRYNVNRFTVTGPLFGKVYDVISIERGWYRIIDESEEDYIYPPEEFEIVNPLPMPPVLTEEEIDLGLGDKYCVVRHGNGVPVDDYTEYSGVELELVTH